MTTTIAALLETQTELVVIDVGARWGAAESWGGLRPQVTVYGFDPDPGECERLNQLARDAGDTSTTYVPVALGSARQEVTLHVTRQPACSSVYPPLTGLIESIPVLADITPVDQVSVELVPLDEWAAANGVERMDALKVDTQGSELDVLRGATRLLATCEWVELEVEFNPIYEGQPLFGDVDAFLRQHGFVLWRLDDLMHYTDARYLPRLETGITVKADTEAKRPRIGGGQLYWAQAYYVREHTITRPEQDRDRSARAALLAHAAGFSDAAVRACPALGESLAQDADAERTARASARREQRRAREQPVLQPVVARSLPRRVVRRLRREISSRRER